ncbi:MAG TPA: GNAT family N-acetyltransferase [Armatimonadota bacterium]|nr:GNAT family N-acetyltransferase [Armatimonadota bacterium]
MTTLGVDPEFRRCGVALQLMIHALEYGRGAGADRGTLEVRCSNVGARKLYEKLGFVVCGVRPGYYLDTGEDALLMWIHDLSAPETYVRIRRLREQRCIRT